MVRKCSFYVEDLGKCRNGYCYYPSLTKEIECDARGFMVARYGDWEKNFLHKRAREPDTNRNP
jgi:hypothetical protein